MGGGAEMGFQGLLNLTCAGVGGAEGEAAVHADVQLNGIAAADAAGAQVVRVVHVGKRGDDVEELSKMDILMKTTSSSDGLTVSLNLTM